MKVKLAMGVTAALARLVSIYHLRAYRYASTVTTSINSREYCVYHIDNSVSQVYRMPTSTTFSGQIIVFVLNRE